MVVTDHQTPADMAWEAMWEQHEDDIRADYCGFNRITFDNHRRDIEAVLLEQWTENAAETTKRLIAAAYERGRNERYTHYERVRHGDHWDHCDDCRATCGTAAEGMAHK